MPRPTRSLVSSESWRSPTTTVPLPGSRHDPTPAVSIVVTGNTGTISVQRPGESVVHCGG